MLPVPRLVATHGPSAAKTAQTGTPPVSRQRHAAVGCKSANASDPELSCNSLRLDHRREPVGLDRRREPVAAACSGRRGVQYRRIGEFDQPGD